MTASNANPPSLDVGDTPALANGGSAARLRRDIDSGLTGDKTDWPDPAAAPLGTDDEAGGFTSHDAHLERTQQQETKRTSKPRDPSGVGSAWILIALVCLLCGSAAGWALFSQ